MNPTRSFSAEEIPAGLLHSAERRMLRRGLAVCAALLAVCVLSEGVLRLLGLGNPILLQADASCGYTLKPNQSVSRFFRHTGTNSLGMRSAEFNAQKPQGAFRIMFLGDSITYGTTQVDQSAIFTELVRRDLEEHLARKVEVLNASASAWAIGNEVAYLRSRGLFESNSLVLVLNSGDLSQPFATITDVSSDLPVIKPNSAIGELISRAVIPRLLHRPGKSDSGTAAASDTGSVVTENLANLSEMHLIATRANARLFVVYVPFRRDVPSGAVASLPEPLSAWAQKEHVPILDLTAKEAARPIGVITLDGVHFNAEGNRIVSEGITPALASMVSRTTQGE
jgi:hypothetical protein